MKPSRVIIDNRATLSPSAWQLTGHTVKVKSRVRVVPKLEEINGRLYLVMDRMRVLAIEAGGVIEIMDEPNKNRSRERGTPYMTCDTTELITMLLPHSNPYQVAVTTISAVFERLLQDEQYAAEARQLRGALRVILEGG